ncbi:MAG: fimbria major subunit [Muribaculaceae bacterium]|nr:fimbria major subunit [Muribaculaceae bacterium]
MKKIMYGLAGALALVASACTSDAPELPNDSILEVDRTCYMKVSISGHNDATRSGASGSEASDFDNGTKEENTVDEIYLVFYDSNGNITANGSPNGGVIRVDTKDNNGWNSTGDMNINQFYQTVVQVDLNKGEGIPAYVMCYVNPFSADYIRNNSLQELESNLRTSEVYKETGGVKRFPMNNSVYYGNDIYQDGNNVLVRATPVPVTALVDSKEDAANNPAVEIYVERVGSKLTFTGADASAISDVKSGNDFTLSFEPEYWTLNADEKAYFLTKNYREQADNETGGYGAFNLTYDRMIEVLGANNISGNNWIWNNPNYFRSYWACSPGYFSTSYPQVSDDVLDMRATEGQDYTLRYKSYNEIVEAGWKSGETKYVRENTVGSAALQGANENIPAALPSVVVVGQYNLKLDGNVVKDADGSTPTFYNYSGTYVNGQLIPSIYFTDAFAKAKNNEKIISIVDVMASTNFKVLVEIPDETDPSDVTKATHVAVGKTVNDKWLVSPSSVFEVKHPEADVRGSQKVNERYVALQLNSKLTKDASGNYRVTGTDGKSYRLTYVTDEGKYRYIRDEATADDTAAVSRLLVNQRLVFTQGYAEAYNTGHAFFNIPVRHLRPGGTFGDYDNVKVGQYGIVRNHTYNILVNKIEGLGTGIENLDHPIVPNKKIKDYFIGYKVNVLNWRVVPTQGVDL